VNEERLVHTGGGPPAAGPAVPPPRTGWRAKVPGAFDHFNFRLFWSGQLVSLIGTWMQSVAQSWLVLQLTNSAFQVGLVTAAQFTPVLLFSLLGGVFADRRAKRRVIMVTQTVAALQALTLGILVVSGNITVGHVIAMAAVLGLVNAFDIPTRQSFVVELVGRRDLMSAIALNSSAFNTARIIGPAIGGVLIARFGVGPLYIINAASYLAVLTSIFFLRGAELQTGRRARESGVWNSLREGVAYVRGDRFVGVATLLVGLVATFAMNYTVLLPVVARDVLQIGSPGFGMLMAALGVGSVLAGLFLATHTGLRPGRTMLLGALGLALFELVFVAGHRLAAPLPVSILCLVGVGFSAICMTATANSAIQQRTPDELRGRVMSVYVTVFSGSVPVGSLLAGAMARKWGVMAAFAIGATLALLAAGGAALALRRATRTEGDRPERSSHAGA